MSRFQVHPTTIDEVVVLERKPITDDRGYLERMFCLADLATVLGGRGIVQINRTMTRTKGTVRGMHLQVPPDEEMKFVTCLRGEVFDVAVDLRRNSPTYQRHHGETLSGTNGKVLVVPEGCAHGFQTMTDDCELLYFHTAAHHGESESGVNATDLIVGIQWPLPIVDRSTRDTGLPTLDQLSNETH